MPDFINNWWEALNFELQIFYGIAIVSGVVLVLQLFMSFFMGADDMDFGGADGGLDIHDSGMSIFSVRGVTAFFTGFGWTGVICKQQGMAILPSVLIAFFVGFSMMVGIYLMMRSLMKLQSSGTLDYGNAVGQMGTAYLTIPPLQRAGGQVETMIQGRLVTAEALQKGMEPIKPGTKVKVVERIGSTTLIVEPLD
ncbi:MAG: NfeD family protein [Akkermansiaceae bacterium]|jgi:membrane-bound ClpP family serine protease|nr:NfeD family protein [Akkermansiaceae bacterium]MDP4647099.1 NfeD family protein [Akkermansiaceae bacterium]MDP4722441.1 NfeD family protein [Akkermansiaceae bacterium]MDP4780155.1 NfeD family protein [Akkermansiaceae bacterium]MDP4847145.1 NfeD family protein [Akkermansiaceae bacterium]